MIDLEKEKYNFEYFCKDYGDINLASESTNRYKNKQTQKMWTFWKARAKEAQQEIAELKAKLAKYESDNFVLVPTIPTMPMLIKGRHSVERLLNMPQLENLYKAMIEAGEIK